MQVDSPIMAQASRGGTEAEALALMEAAEAALLILELVPIVILLE